MKIYYEFSQDLEDLELAFIEEKNNQVYKSFKKIPKEIRIDHIKFIVDWFNMCLEDVEKLEKDLFKYESNT